MSSGRGSQKVQNGHLALKCPHNPRTTPLCTTLVRGGAFWEIWGGWSACLFRSLDTTSGAGGTCSKEACKRCFPLLCCVGCPCAQLLPYIGSVLQVEAQRRVQTKRVQGAAVLVHAKSFRQVAFASLLQLLQDNTWCWSLLFAKSNTEMLHCCLAHKRSLPFCISLSC